MIIEKLYKEGRFQEAIDYSTRSYKINSASNARYNAKLEIDTAGVTYMKNGKITMDIGPEAFTRPTKGLGLFDASRLPGTLYHEGVHVDQFSSGVVSFDPISRSGVEAQAYLRTLQNATELDLSSAVKDYYNMRYLTESSRTNSVFDYSFAEMN